MGIISERYQITLAQKNLPKSERRKVNNRRYHQRHKGEKEKIDSGRVRTTRHRLKEKYGLSLEAYQKMLAEQGGVCAICQKPEHHIDGRYKTIVQLSVDHNHITKKVRALLCRDCNRGIGSFNDDKEMLKAAYEYLQRYN